MVHLFFRSPAAGTRRGPTYLRVLVTALLVPFMLASGGA